MKECQKIPQLGFGTWGLSGKSYGNIDQGLAVRLLKEAYERGIKFYDTAPAYGNGGVENLLGNAFSSQHDICICTKVGLSIADNGVDLLSTDRNSIEKSIEASLKRLKKDSIDLLLVHSPVFSSSLQEELLHQHLEELKVSGKILQYGISFKSPQDIVIFSEVFKKIYAIEMNFSIADQRAIEFESLTNIAQLRVARTPFNYGFLINESLFDATFNSQFDHRYRINRTIKNYWKCFYNFLNELSLEVGITKQALCLKFCLDSSNFNIVIPGIMSTEDLNSNLECMAPNTLSDDVIKAIKDFYASKDVPLIGEVISSSRKV